MALIRHNICQIATEVTPRMHWAFITPDLCELAHANGLGVQCFMDDPELARTLAEWGVDFMDADHPDRVKRAVREL